jgi:hypothetical protein
MISKVQKRGKRKDPNRAGLLLHTDRQTGRDKNLCNIEFCCELLVTCCDNVTAILMLVYPNDP